jgi:phosphoglycerate dehydrogenase-like enzyme
MACSIVVTGSRTIPNLEALGECVMKMVLWPALETERLAALQAVAPSATFVNGGSVADMADADAFFGKLTPELLVAARQLRWVQAPTVSLEHYMFPELMAHPCQLTNMRGLFSDVIAEQVMGYLICFTRNLHRYIRQQMQGIWQPLGGESERTTFLTGPGTINGIDRAHGDLGDRTLGIVGLGAIGQEIARLARVFRMNILAVDPRNPEAWPLDRLSELLAASDFVVIAAPHTPQTERLFNRALLQQMKPTAYLVNIGRGAIVVLDDLVAALNAGELAGAALDVFETEPLPPDSPLWAMGDRVILTPHVAGYSVRIAERHLAVVVENVRRFTSGQPLLNVVDKENWY